MYASRCIKRGERGFRERKIGAEVLAGGPTKQEVAERRRNFSVLLRLRTCSEIG